MIVKIISGGQTGADQGGLEAAFELQIETGGYIPREYRTENGNCPSLAKYNLIEHKSRDYPPRTKLNIASSDGTILFGKLQGGTKLTSDICRLFRKADFHVRNPQDFSQIPEVISWLEEFNIEILNVAGNRESKYPGLQEDVRIFMKRLLENVGVKTTKRKN